MMVVSTIWIERSKRVSQYIVGEDELIWDITSVENIVHGMDYSLHNISFHIQPLFLP